MAGTSASTPSIANKSLSFENTEIAFREKTNADLNRAFWLFKVLSSNFLTRVGPPLTLFALKIGLPLNSLIKSTIFKHFCGGETIRECETTVKALSRGHVGSILDYSVEGAQTEAVFDATCKEVVKTIERAKGDPDIPLSVFKISGIGRFGLLEKVNGNIQLSEAEEQEFNQLKKRVDTICAAALEARTPLMVDAEETWIQDAIDTIALEMMRKYNGKSVVVYNTYQLYRADKLASLKADAGIAQTNGFILGAKLVRGAYMEKERKRAEEFGYPSPINASKEATDRDYNDAIVFCAANVSSIAFVAGTHNENSCLLLTELMHQQAIDPGGPEVYFSQLLGMSDNLSFNLADAGFNVAKYVPYGPVKEVLPYLFRRAEENTSIAGQTGRELSLIAAERKRRKLS